MASNDVNFNENMKKLMIIGILMIIGGTFSIIFGIILIGNPLVGFGLIIIGIGLICFGIYAILNWIRILKESLQS